MGSRLRGSKRRMGGRKRGMNSRFRRSLHDPPISPTATPITLTSLLSQYGRGGRREEDGFPPSREQERDGREEGDWIPASAGMTDGRNGGGMGAHGY